jgi:putative RNA 2'-phosphotransferase
VLDDRLTRLSKTLAYVLRHDPSSVGVTLDLSGWTTVDGLLEKMNRAGHGLSEADLATIVSGSDKERFEVQGSLIRAAQGHSIDVDLGLTASTPPEQLFHGTVGRFLDQIRADGLLAGNRRHVHLSADVPSARAIGARRGRPVVVAVDAGRMHKDGYEFLLAANGVWLTERVPPEFIEADIS